MKLAKLSLAAIAVVGLSTSSFAADTLADAFKNGKVSGTLKTQYIGEDFSGTKDSTTGFAVGGELKFKTDSYKGFAAGFTFETAHTLGLDDDNNLKNDGTVNIQETELSEAYLTYTMGKTTAKVGRQYIKTPLVSVSGSRVIMDYFQAALVTNTDLANTTIVVGAVNEWTKRGGFTTTAVHLDDPIYTAYVKNTSVKGLTLTAQGTFVSDIQNDYFVEAGYTIDAGMPIKVGAQYVATDYDAGSDAALYGLMAGTSFGAFSLNAYYNNNSDDAAVAGGWGNGNDPSYNDMWGVNGLGKNTESYSLQAKYKVSPELSLMAWYGVFDSANDVTDLDIDVMYKPSGALKGASINLKYTMLDYDTEGTNKESHLYAMVKYAF